jgi:hypothetical protein
VAHSLFVCSSRLVGISNEPMKSDVRSGSRRGDARTPPSADTDDRYDALNQRQDENARICLAKHIFATDMGAG